MGLRRCRIRRKLAEQKRSLPKPRRPIIVGRDLALAVWASRATVSKHKSFKPLRTAVADVLEDRHDDYRIYEKEAAILQF